MIITIICAATLVNLPTTKTWFGGNTVDFARFLAGINVPDIVMEVGHVAVVPRLVFSKEHPEVFPEFPRNLWTTRSKFGKRVLSGYYFSPKIFACNNFEDSFKWTTTMQLRKLRANPKLPDLNDFYGTGELLSRGDRKLKFPNPRFNDIVCYVRANNLPAEQSEILAAEIADHEVYESKNGPELRPRVAVLKEKILRTLGEYAGDSENRSEVFQKLDLETLRGLPESTWYKLLTMDTGFVQINLAGTPQERQYDAVFRRLLSLDVTGEDQSLQDYFSKDRVGGLQLAIGGDLSVMRLFKKTVNGKPTLVFY